MNDTSLQPQHALHTMSGLHTLASQQDYPCACLYMVATPIGNIADISARALHVLNLVDTIACEDTRHSKPLLQRLGIHKHAAQWLALHEHNEMDASQTVLERLAKGERVAYISDAGTPAVSDPGARLVHAARQAGYRIIPIPGASSVTTLLSASGIFNPQGHSGCVFLGFLPSEGKARKEALLWLATLSLPVVLLEAPHRIRVLAQELHTLGTRTITLGRELTKQFEEIAHLACQDFPDWLSDNTHRLKGEYTLVLHPLATPDGTSESIGPSTQARKVLKILLDAGIGTKNAAKLTADITGESKNLLYQTALEEAKTSLE